MLDFMGSWGIQADGVGCWLSFAAESVFAFDVDEPGSRRGAQRQAEEDAPHV